LWARIERVRAAFSALLEARICYFFASAAYRPMKRPVLPTVCEHDELPPQPGAANFWGACLVLLACYCSTLPMTLHAQYEWSLGTVHDIAVHPGSWAAVLLGVEGSMWLTRTATVSSWPENRADPRKALVCAANGAALSLWAGLASGERAAPRLLQDAGLACVAPVLLFVFEQLLFQTARPNAPLFGAYLATRAASLLPNLALAWSYENSTVLAAATALACVADLAAWRFATSETYSYARLWAATSVTLAATKLLYLLL